MGILVRNNKVIEAGGKILYRQVSPFELPNLKLYLSATRMVQQTDGSSVLSFTDFSGNGFHAVQGTGSLQPTFETNEFGINAGIKFDGVDDFLSFSGGALDIFRNVNQYTVQVLCKRSAISTTSAVLYFSVNGSTTNRFLINFLSSGDIQIVNRMLDATVSGNIVLMSSNDTNEHLIQVTVYQSIMYCYLDGVLRGQIGLEAATSSNTASTTARVGTSPAPVLSSSVVNGVSINQTYSDPSTIQAQYRGYLERGYL